MSCRSAPGWLQPCELCSANPGSVATNLRAAWAARRRSEQALSGTPRGHLLKDSDLVGEGRAALPVVEFLMESMVADGLCWATRILFISPVHRWGGEADDGQHHEAP